MLKSIALVTGGGDAPGLNAVIRAAVKTAVHEYGMRVIGVEDSFEGLLGETRVRELTPADVRGLLPRGGTILGTRNRGRFVERGPEGERKPEEVYREAIRNLERLGVDALVAVGGEGTLAIAAEFDRLGFPVVGVPKTIDNDLAATELTFGFMTALDIATEALDRLHTTAESHDRAMVLEVMGRHAGWIALHSGVSGGADLILLPEIPFSMANSTPRTRSSKSIQLMYCSPLPIRPPTPSLNGVSIFCKAPPSPASTTPMRRCTTRMPASLAASVEVSHSRQTSLRKSSPDALSSRRTSSPRSP